MRSLQKSIVALVVAAGFLAVSPERAHGQAVALWGWRNIVAPELGGPWIAPDVRFRPLGILDGDPIWRRGQIPQSQIIVNVPDTNSRVWLQGQATQTVGTQRVFITPPLQPGFNYNYEIRVRTGEGNLAKDETRTVPVRSGEQVIVDFSQPAAPTIPRAKD